MSVVSSRYARAFVDVIFDTHLDSNRALQELRAIEATAQTSQDLRRVWETPAIPAEQKRKVLDAIVSREGISRPVRNFIAVLIDHRRITLLSEVIRDFEVELDKRLGFSEAEIISARDLSERERHALETQVEQVTG